MARSLISILLLLGVGCAHAPHTLSIEAQCEAEAPKGRVLAGWIVDARDGEVTCLYWPKKLNRYKKTFPKPFAETPEKPRT